MELTKEHRLQAMIPKDLVRRARIVAANKAVGLSEVVRTALQEHVEREEGASSKSNA
ncbi:hypothetical protein SAMN05444172_1574 [Burkholderia sp. GAS332]|nr:hypothetical protein SAMN05444172_1574 [Burkholderia sp. GAS332]